jgi:CRP-like cAMP-binding protein
MDEEKLIHLSKIAFLEELTQQEMTELASDFQWQTYPEGFVLIEQAKKVPSVYLLCEGSVEVIAKINDHFAPSLLGPGSVFGEIPLVTGKPALYTVQCSEKTRVLRIDAEDFGRILLRWPKIYRTIIEQLSENLNEANQMLSESKYKEVLRSAIKLTQYRDKFYGIWGSVRTTHEVERKLEELKQRKDNLLILGERGTGRQMVAWYAHQRLFGEIAPFVVVDGRRFDQQWGNLMKGLFDIAAGGTLLIQEIDLISPTTQLMLAEILKYQNLCFVIGSIQTEPKATEEKIIPELRDCFGHTHHITPLRKRKRDIPILVQGILEKLAHKNNRKTPSLSPEATQLLLSHNYRQGNVTELIQVIERAFFLAEQDAIGLEQIFFGPTSKQVGRKIDLLQWPFLENLIRKGSLLFELRRISTVLFIFLILQLIFSPHLTVTMKVFSLVWGLWWPGLAVISPFLGRLWCTICPFSSIMDFVQKKINLRLPIPAFIMKYDYLIVSTLFLFIFWIEIFTEMRFNSLYTAFLLILIQLAAIFISILFPRHAWCRHFCPLGGFIGTASIGSILEVRADPEVCLNKCTTFECYVGKEKVPGCPMSQHLPYLDNNLDCKLCFNCVRNCQHGSVQVNLRVPAREVWHLTRVNQGYTIFIGVMLAILFPIIYFEPLQKIWPSSEWHLWFTISYFAFAFIGGVLGWWIGKPFKTKSASIRTKLVFSFTPLVIAGHIIYQVSYIPGIQALLLGAGYQTPSGFQTIFVPALSVAQGIATIIGLILTSLTVSVVLLRRKTKRAS